MDKNTNWIFRVASIIVIIFGSLYISKALLNKLKQFNGQYEEYISSNEIDRHEFSWIHVGTEFFNQNPGSLGHNWCVKDGLCGLGYVVEASSIVKRGAFRYFKLNIVYTNKDGSLLNKEFENYKEWTVNCKNETIGSTADLWAPLTNGEEEVIKFVCN